MQLEVRFTVPDLGREIPFTILQERDGAFCLYSSHDGVEYTYPISQEAGLFSLLDPNPFAEADGVVQERLTGLSADWVENLSQGFDSTTETAPTGPRPGYGPEDIFVENKPFSLKQILDLIEEGDIELTPDFQRNFVWDKTRQSKLIESILLGLPLPSIYLSQYEDGRLTVVDGLQRLSTILSFMGDRLSLSNLEYLENCNGHTYSELANVLSPLRLRRFGQTQVMCYVIDYRSPSQLKFDLFRRLNTGGKPLNNQEIRNCLSRPQVQAVLKEMVALDSFGLATDYSVKDTRMDAREAALRFIYFYEQYSVENPVGEYNGDMETTLDDFIDELNGRGQELSNYIRIYDNALGNAYYLFGKHCFRKVLPSTLGGRRAPVNKLLMLTLSIILSKYSEEDVVGIEEGSLTEPLANLIDTEQNLFETITYGTNAKANIEKGFRVFGAFIDRFITATI